jgi:O-antigen ligase
LARGRLEQVGEIYGRWAPLILVWLPVGLVFSRLGGEFGNVLKAGDVGVHLGGLAAYQLLQLRSGRAMSPVRTTLLAAAWLVTFALVAGTNRGGTLSALAAILIVAVTTRGKVARQLAGAAFLAVFVGTVLVATDVSIDLGFGRRFSASQIVANLQSVTGKSRDEGLEGTRRWRLQWWGEIVDYTVYGPYFWQGKGFGVNLASADGIEDRTGTLRSPHNGHLTVLARSGVPGLALWLLLQGAFAATLLRARHRARRMGEERVARMLLWVLAYWMAMLINATFDVYLEGPQGGIWYWSLMAAGIALAARVPRPEASTRVTRRHS